MIKTLQNSQWQKKLCIVLQLCFTEVEIDLIEKQSMAEQGHTRSLSSKLNLKMNWDGQLGPSVAKLWLNKNMVDM